MIIWPNDSTEIVSSSLTPVLNSNADMAIGPRSKVVRFHLDEADPDVDVAFNIGVGGASSGNHTAFAVAFKITLAAGDSSYWSGASPSVTVTGPSQSITDNFQYGGSTEFSSGSWDLGDPINDKEWIVVGGVMFPGTQNDFTFTFSSGIPGSTAFEVYLDVGYIMRGIPFTLPAGISMDYGLRFIDGSRSQRSDGGQKYSTRVNPRRQARFNFEANAEDDIIGTTLFGSLRNGLIQIQKTVGSVKPVVIVPSQTRSIKDELVILGTVEEWPELTPQGGQLWRQGPLIIDELV